MQTSKDRGSKVGKQYILQRRRAVESFGCSRRSLTGSGTVRWQSSVALLG